MTLSSFSVRPGLDHHVFSMIQRGIETSSHMAFLAAQNFSNAETTPMTPKQEPYRRHMALVTGENHQGWVYPKLTRVTQDYITPFQRVHMPYHPGADVEGFVQKPNINTFMESTEYQEKLHTQEILARMRESWMKVKQTFLSLLKG